MKKIVVGLILAVVVMFGTAEAQAEYENNKLIQEYAKIYGEEISECLTLVENDNIKKVIPGFSIDELLQNLAKGERVFSPGEIIERLLNLLFGEMRKIAKLLVVIPVIAVLNTYITGMQQNYQLKGATSAAFFVTYSVMAGIGAAAFVETVRCCQGVVENVAIFMRGIVPVSLASMATSGAVVSATSFEVVLISVIELTELAVEKLFVPLVMMSAALNIANNLSKFFNAEKIVQLLNKFVKWGTGIMLTLFVGVMGIQGIVAGSADGLSVKLTKFATSNLVPMVGGILAETVETVMNCSVVIKNAVGVVGIIVVILIAVLPLIKASAYLIMFRVCAALIQPVSDEKCTKCVSEMGDAISSVLGMTTAVVVMFVILLTILINIGNAAVMLGR
jgi:stage III sporulation protein AE